MIGSSPFPQPFGSPIIQPFGAAAPHRMAKPERPRERINA